MAKIQPGVSVLLNDRLESLKGQRVGLVTNPTGVNEQLTSTLDLLLRSGQVNVTALYSGEHGLRGDIPAGVHVPTLADPATGLPVHSLYGKTKKPTPEMLEGVDTLIFDMQDAGARFYTYTWTLAYCLEAAAELGKRVVVLDRPNPIGGAQVEGGLVKPGFESFVGLYPTAIRHGLTHGEIARWLNQKFLGARCDLEVIPMKGWERSMWWEETGLPFVPMSPNTNEMTMLALYTGTCFIEGTNLSEGRGTTLPFQLFGAPWLDEQAVIKELRSRELPGVLFRPVYFTPLASKHKEQFCRGVQVHVTDRQSLRPVTLGAHLIDVVKRVHPEQFEWYRWSPESKCFFDLLTGSDRLRTGLDAGEPVESILAEWDSEARAFADEAREYHLYK